MVDEPTAASEFRRSFSADNLTFGAVPSIAIGAVVALLTWLGTVPDVLEAGAIVQSVAVTALLFSMITAMHAALHTYFGWRFAHGIRASAAGDHRRAVRFLSPVEARGMSHYDPQSRAVSALRTSRAALVPVGRETSP